jgi:hypothetical protein
MTGRGIHPKLWSLVRILLWTAAAGVAIVNVLLVRENARLRTKPNVPVVPVGRHLRDLAGVTPTGQMRTLAMPVSGAHLLIIAFSPWCSFCAANKAGWLSLARDVRQRGWNVVWFSRDRAGETKEYCAREGMTSEVVMSDPPYRTFNQLGLATVPETIVVGPGGVVERVWVGRLDSSGWRQVAAYVGAGQAILPAANGPAEQAGACDSGPGSASPATCAK